MKINVQKSMLSMSAAPSEYSWYEYKGATFVVQGGTARRTIKEGDKIGICPIARQKEYYLITPDAPKKKYRITPQRATKIGNVSRKLKRVILAGEPKTDAVTAVLDTVSTQRWDSERFKPAVAPRNESFGRNGGEAQGVNTKDYQWRIVREPLLEVRTKKALLKFKRGDTFGIRFIKENQGGKIVDLNGLYELLPTETYDFVVANTKLVPHAQWPATTIAPERIAEYQTMKDRRKRQERREQEAEQRAQQVAERKQQQQADIAARENEKQRRVEDGKENTEIAKQIAEVAKQENARQEQELQQRRDNVGATRDEELRKMRASKMKPLDDVLNEDEAEEDEDFGDDVEVPDEPEKNAQPKSEMQDAAEVEGSAISDAADRMVKAYNTLLDKATSEEDKAALRAKFVVEVKKVRNGGGNNLEIADAWEAFASKGDVAGAIAGSDAGPNAGGATDGAAGDEGADPAEQGGEGEDAGDGDDAGAADEDDIPEETEDDIPEEAEDDADAEDPNLKDHDDVNGDGVIDEADLTEDDEKDWYDPADSDFDEEEVTDDEFDDSEFDDDIPEEAEDGEGTGDGSGEDDIPEEAEDDEDDGFGGADPDVDLDADADAEDGAAEDGAADDADGIAKGIIGDEEDADFDEDPAVNDLAEIEEEDLDAPPSEEEKPAPKKEAPKPKKPEPEEPVDDEEQDLEDEEEEQVDMPKAAGKKGAEEQADEGMLVTFKDDTKLKRRWLILSVKPNAANDRVMDYTLWDYDNKPEETRVTRVNTGRQQTLLSRADKVGELTPKEFNEARAEADNYDENNEPIKS